jgi:DNA recombination protein RmuC
MEMSSLFVEIFAGAAIAALLTYFFFKSTHVTRESFDKLNFNHIKSISALENSLQKNEENHQNLLHEKEINRFQSDIYNQLNNDFAKISAQNSSLLFQIEEQKDLNSKQAQHISSSQKEKEEIFARNAELSAINQSLKNSLENQKGEITKMQELAKNEFQNLANKILEEKTEKFTTINQTNLKNILEPFQEKITELRNKVGETYDKESKERFSLGEKVKELALLNQQISEDAKKLTRALKGESKTQGNWGEMILESILEKSGLVKGREYFLEHELRDENNKALFSEFSGKKMRPDAVVKYPDERNVIIDSKVSLTAFVELVDENDPELYEIKIAQHLQSVKNHIKQLSDKAYDDYDKSLDFVMMFIPSEPAYITAMQAEPDLWNFAYEKRILLLNPSNLIISLKLVADLWKREYQNKNATEIAERGAKLYDKFVGFVENLEKLGKNIDNTKNIYNEAYKQLYTGNDNLIVQTNKLKALGIKNKKSISPSLEEQADMLPDITE